jgi:hypothetical protein
MQNFTGGNSWRNYLEDGGEYGKTILFFVSHFFCSLGNVLFYPVSFFYSIKLLIIVIKYYNHQQILAAD